MHSPSLMSPVVTDALVASRSEGPRHRVTRSRGAGLRFRRRNAASPQLVPRGRTSVPPFAH